MDWRSIELLGAASIARVAGVHEVRDLRGIPGSKYKVKVLERGDDFVAVANVAVRAPQGGGDWIAGLGKTAGEALQDVIARFDAVLRSRSDWGADDFEWSDPHDF